MENLLRKEDGSPGCASTEFTATEFTATEFTATEFTATVRIDRPAETSYYLHGGILPYILRQLLRADQSDEKVV